MSDFTQTLDADGLATITWDCQSRPMNVMSTQGFADLSALIDGCLIDPEVKGVIITSAKSDFAAGMDLAVIAETKDMHPENPALWVVMSASEIPEATTSTVSPPP